MRVFICSPYRGDVEQNIRNAKAFSRQAALGGYSPVVPHLLFPQFLNEDDLEERQVGIQLGLEQLAVCDEIWIFRHTISDGMKIEIQKATELNIRIVYKSQDDSVRRYTHE